MAEFKAKALLIDVLEQFSSIQFKWFHCSYSAIHLSGTKNINEVGFSRMSKRGCLCVAWCASPNICLHGLIFTSLIFV